MAEQIRNNINSSAGPPPHVDIVIAAYLMGVKGSSKHVNICMTYCGTLFNGYVIFHYRTVFFECLVDSIIIKYSFSLVNS